MNRSLTRNDLQAITHVTQNMGLVLASRLARYPDPNGLFALQRIMVGLYENAVFYLGEVREYGSHEAGRLATTDLIERLVRSVASVLPDEN